MGNVEYAECYAELANAIVLQAFKDYRKALFKLVQEPEEWKHRSSKKKLERFFHSKWYRTLTDLDPAILMQEAKRQADINVERWERGRARARERAERKTAIRRNVCVPLPQVDSLEDLNTKLLEQCAKYMNHKIDGRSQKVGQMLAEDQAHLHPLPKYVLDISKKAYPKVNRYSTVLFDTNYYSVPCKYRGKGTTVNRLWAKA